VQLWYRELPSQVMSAIPVAQIEGWDGSHDQAELSRLVGCLSPVNLDLLWWLVDLCVQITCQREVNKMGSKNLGTFPLLIYVNQTQRWVRRVWLTNVPFSVHAAIVIAPNLYSFPETTDPMACLFLSQKLVEFFEALIVRKMRELGIDS
jgi:hypothetical protein